jgi:predicted NBD/HSP70 family sugar kinase
MFVLFDVGGTHTRITLSHDGKSLHDPIIYSTPLSYNAGLKKMIETIEFLAQGKRIDAIVGGLPGITDKKSGKLLFAAHIEAWEHKNLREDLVLHFHIPVMVQNDAALAGLGEATFGAGKNAPIVAFLTVSTGVGGARIVHGKIDETTLGFEPGHQLIAPGLELESVVSGSALEKKYNKSPHDIHDEAIWNEQTTLLAEGIHNLIVFWSPSVIVIGGPMVLKTPGIQINNIVKALEKTLTFESMPRIVEASLGDRAGLYGALAYATTTL